MNFQFGVDYYPEHWPEDRWETDARLMAEMGLKVVRLAEFAWAKLEPADGRFEFAWLDRALAVLDRRGLKVVLGTPTACPPAWLIEAHPDILPVDSQGRVRGFGGRHHDCQSNPVYRRYSERLVRAMADHWGKDARVVGWQTDNELGNSHDDLCHCGHCRAAFQAWLARRYGDVARLNTSWGTVFWSQTYSSFSQIPTPTLTPVNTHSPSLLLDWKRFHSDLIVDFQRAQIEVLRPLTPGQFITHNCMGFANTVDYFDLARELDFVSHDQYPVGFWEVPPGRSAADLAAALDLMAGLKRRSFWIMEQQSGPTGWQILAKTPRPGQLALWTAQSVAHGADTVVFFRWRSCTVGTEQYWHGILPHNGVPGRRYAELKGLIGGLGPLMPRFEGALSGAEVAIVHSYDQNWAFEIQPHHPDLDYQKYLLAVYRAFHGRQIPVDLVSDADDLRGYKLVVAPLAFLELPGVVQRLKEFVGEGGHLVLTMRTGVKDQANVCQTSAPLPGPYADLLGLEVLDYDCLRDGPVPVEFDGQKHQGSLWWDVVTPKGAQVVAWADGGDHKSEPAVTRNGVGKGTAWYVGTQPDAGLWAALAGLWAAQAAVEPVAIAQAGVELVRRRTAEGDFVFVLNHTAEAVAFEPKAAWHLVLGEALMPPWGFSVYETRKRGVQ